MLGPLLARLPKPTDPALLVGHETMDDASVYRLADDLAIVQSVDIFTPVVDDPVEFGRIAAANALSDLYAMGARPVTALAIVAFPSRTLPHEILEAILRGGVEKAREAGIDVAGGHAIDDAEPKYGLAVTGVVHPDRVVRNEGARPGDALVLTKPIGTGILTTAEKRGLLSEAARREMCRVMGTLNRGAAEAMAAVGVHACTDVTGFGLLGHLSEMVAASGVSARIHLGALPLLPETRAQIEAGVCPGGTRRNLAHFGKRARFAPELREADRLLVADAQTSGGLLMACPPDRVEDLLARLEAAGTPARALIGEVIEGEGEVEVVR